MKIAYILGSFPVFSETFIVREILELQQRGHEVLVFAQNNTIGRLSGNIIHEDAEKLIKDVCYFSTLRKQASKPQLVVYHLFLLLLNPFKYIRALLFSIFNYKKAFRFFLRSVVYIKEIKKFEADHIHAHFALKSCKLAMLISIITGIPYSFTIHAHDIFILDKSELMTDKFNRSKFVVSISQFNKHYVLKKYPEIIPDKINIIHCGIDFKTDSPSTKANNKVFTILSVGRLDGQKGFKYLIQACNALKNRMNIDFKCNIIGEGEERQELEEIIIKSNLSGVVFLNGAMEQSDVMEALKKTDLFVLPCVVKENGAMDGIPVALMEAMAMEIPVISTRVSGIPELIGHGGGILVDAKDVEGLAIEINEFASLSNEKRAEIGKRGRAIIERDFNLEKEVRKLEKLFAS